MVTASHNENGWTGVKMGAQRPLTFGPDEINALKKIVLERSGQGAPRRQPMSPCPTCARPILQAVTKGHKLSRPIKVIAACGNGTAGAFAPEALRRIGAEVIGMDAELDYTFPKYNPNPEDLHMLHAMGACGEGAGRRYLPGLRRRWRPLRRGGRQGREIFADKIGVLLARDLSAQHPNAQFVVDVKSTGLYLTDPVLKERGVKTDYWKTGHSYIKRRTAELRALAGFEKSGHFFFNPPIGHGYDDGIVAGIAVLEMLDRAGGKKTVALYDGLPKTWGSPTMAPYCPDDKKYAVVEALMKEYSSAEGERRKNAGPEDRQRRHRQWRARDAWKTAPGAWCAPPPTSRRWWWWWKARCRKPICAPCSPTSMRGWRSIPKWANTTRRSSALGEGA